MSPYPEPTPDAAIHVASLIGVHDVLAATRARFLVTVLHAPALMPTPQWIDPPDHLRIGCHDIVEEGPGVVAPEAAHVADLIGFAQHWNRRGPLVIHCMAGISRSTASAFIVLCALNPAVSEVALARHLRAMSASAIPNRRLVALADDALGRAGRMRAAIAGLDLGEALGAPARPFRLASSLIA